MAKRSQHWTEDKIRKYTKSGRGQGEGTNYKPWLTIQDVPSHGRVHRIKGNTIPRIYQLMSDMERDYFYILDWAEDVIDIREQYPLERSTTMVIADELGITHPSDPSTGVPIVMTTDFLITVHHSNQVALIARTVKPSEKLNNRRTIEKFEIEREYWSRKLIDWGMITEYELPKQLCVNLGILHPRFNGSEEEILLAPRMLQHIKHANPASTFSSMLYDFRVANGLDKAQAVSIFKHLLATKQILSNWGEPFSLTTKCADIKVAGVCNVSEGVV